MDSVGFCGQVCHTAMQPEFVAHQDGPHAHVACVRVPRRPRRDSFAKAKLAGTRQVLAVTFGTYRTADSVAAANLRPARDTCEQCHWPEQFHGDKVRRIASTPTTRRTPRR